MDVSTKLHIQSLQSELNTLKEKMFTIAMK